MASRSFKPASYLASAAQPSKSSRPSFARTSSSSSTHSNHSEDSFIATLRSLSTKDKDKDKDREDAVGATGGDGHTPGKCVGVHLWTGMACATPPHTFPWKQRTLDLGMSLVLILIHGF
jgi:hypothetical protein